MFTGIVTGFGEVRSTTATGRGGAAATVEIAIRGPWKDLGPGESVAVDGACLTATSCAADGTFVAQASPETLDRTTLGRLRAGSKVHLERALRLSDRLGGHLVTGHVDAVGRVASSHGRGKVFVLEIEVPGSAARHLVEKGSVAVDGVSLSVNRVDGSRFSVTIVPFTARSTRLGAARAGDEVNVETDILAKYVEKALGRDAHGGVTMETLERAGFPGGGRGR